VTPPNIISLARLISVPLIVWLMLEHRYTAAFWLFIAAGISDGVDGFLAKRFGWQTQLGSFLDPLADKALLVSIYVTLGMQGYLPSWLVILVVSRDILIVGAVLLSLFLGHGLHVEPLRISKANTVAQIALAGLMLGAMDYGVALEWVVRLGSIVVALTTIASGTSYVIAWVREMAAWESPSPDRNGDEGRG
jgi:cardiolipin synthase